MDGSVSYGKEQCLRNRSSTNVKTPSETSGEGIGMPGVPAFEAVPHGANLAPGDGRTELPEEEDAYKAYLTKLATRAKYDIDVTPEYKR
jgi:hypothetical protein